MNTYIITIKNIGAEDLTGLSDEFTGTFEALTEEDAIRYAKEEYAQELGTDEDSIEIVTIIKKVKIK